MEPTWSDGMRADTPRVRALARRFRLLSAGGSDVAREVCERAGNMLLLKAAARFKERGSWDPRAAAIWDAAAWLRESAADEILTACADADKTTAAQPTTAAGEAL